MMRWARLRTALPYAALLGVVALRLSEASFVIDLRLWSFDQLQRIEPRTYEEVGVRIVDIDDETLERIGQWPWSRTRVAELVSRLTDLGVASIAFDIVFAEPDRTAPARLLEGWQATDTAPALRAILEELPDPDQVLADAIAKSNVVLGFVPTGGTTGRTPARKNGLAHAGEDPRPYLPPYRSAVTNLPALEERAAGNGSFSIGRDRDGRIRRVPLLYRIDDTIYPSLAAEALRVAIGASTYLVRSSGASGTISFGEDTGIQAVRISPQFVVPTDPQGRVWLHYTRPEPARYVPAWQVLDGSADPERLAGHIVLIGTSAAGLKDMRATPLDPEAPGVSIHAETLEHILLDSYLKRPDWATGAELTFTVLWGGLLLLLISRSGALWGAWLGLCGIAGASAITWFAFTESMLLFDPVFPSLAGFAVYLSGSLANYLSAEAERKQIRGAFAQYLPADLVEQVAAHPERLKLGGEMRDMSVLFCDIRGFTTISEKLTAEELTLLLNTFLTPMTDVIHERRGTIDKYMGDCIMSFWNAPLDNPNHARDACDAALAMQLELEVVNTILASENESFPGINIGIGINTGPCCVGNMGSKQRFDYSVLGDSVNLASRLEGQSKTYGVTIVVGEDTRAAAPQFAALELDLIRVKGKTRPVKIFALLGDAKVAASEKFCELVNEHEQMLHAYRSQEFERALELIESCLALAPYLDTLYALYRERIEQYLVDPPPKDWDCVYTATSK